jgi:hypothetical protein
MPRFFRENGLSLVLFGVFFFSLVGQYLTGMEEYNKDQRDHRQPIVSHVEYLSTGHFIEAVFENWESEFLQMAAYVILTVFLIQKGSSESRKPDTVERQDVVPETARADKDSPYPVRRGGFILKLYENSLSIALLALFAASFALHAYGGAKDYNQEQAAHGETEMVTTLEYIGTSRFWFESFQNWQSEFFSMGMMVVLSIFLRQKGSPESKPVDSPHSETGNS